MWPCTEKQLEYVSATYELLSLCTQDLGGIIRLFFVFEDEEDLPKDLGGIVKFQVRNLLFFKVIYFISWILTVIKIWYGHIQIIIMKKIWASLKTMFIRSIKLLAYLIGFYKQVQLSYYSKRQRIHLRICVHMITWLYYNNMFFSFQFSF